MAIREKLLQNLQNEGLSHVRHKVGDAVAEVARQYAENGRLPYFRLLHLCGYMPINSIAAIVEAGISHQGSTDLFQVTCTLPLPFPYKISLETKKKDRSQDYGDANRRDQFPSNRQKSYLGFYFDLVEK